MLFYLYIPVYIKNYIYIYDKILTFLTSPPPSSFDNGVPSRFKPINLTKFGAYKIYIFKFFFKRKKYYESYFVLINISPKRFNSLPLPFTPFIFFVKSFTSVLRGTNLLAVRIFDI